MVSREKFVYSVIISSEKILLVKKKNEWVLPGAKSKTGIGESELECICREFKKNFPSTKLKNFNFYKEFSRKSPSGNMLNISAIYFVDIDGNLGESSEKLEDVQWVNDFENYGLSGVTLDVVNSLKSDSYLENRNLNSCPL